MHKAIFDTCNYNYSTMIMVLNSYKRFLLIFIHNLEVINLEPINIFTKGGVKIGIKVWINFKANNFIP